MRSSGPILAPREVQTGASTRDVRDTSTTTRHKIAIFADGANVEEILAVHRAGGVDGFTTNPTLMRQAGVDDYVAFAQKLLSEIKDVPVSFEVFADDLEAIERQARLISSWGPNVYVKVPVMNTRGVSTAPVVSSLVHSGIKLNVTALLTVDQVREVVELLMPEVPAIVSVFAGRIADTGRDPVPVMADAVRVLRRRPLARLLWASPREVLNLYQAESVGCHIVTMTKALLDKIPLGGRDLLQLSRETVQMFHGDAQRAGYTL